MYSFCENCHLDIFVCRCDEKKNKLTEKSWISLGDRQFYVEDVQSIFIQANHLIINFDYTDKQVVIFFGHHDQGYKNAKIVFDALAEMYGAYEVALPDDAIVSPNIMDTVYKVEVSRKIQNEVRYEKDKIKKRYEEKYENCLQELEILKKKIAKTT